MWPPTGNEVTIIPACEFRSAEETGITESVSVPLVVELWILYMYLGLPLLTSAAVDRMWCHVTCVLTGTSCKLAEYEQARNEPGCKHELIAACRVCSGIHEVRVQPETSSIRKVSLFYQRVALPHVWLLPLEIVMYHVCPLPYDTYHRVQS